jgi:hypothetical protein
VPTEVFSADERGRMDRFPAEIAAEDINRFFRLAASDLAFLRRRSSAAAWLVGGVQIGALRTLGFAPDSLDVPAEVVGFVADQVDVRAAAWSRYTRRPETRREHLQAVEEHLGWRRPSRGDLKALGDWLVERALEHDQPRVLFDLACEHLRAERVVRPGVTVLERLSAAARERATQETHLRLGPQLTAERRGRLDQLLDFDAAVGTSRLAWLRVEAPTARAAAIKDQLAKLEFLRSFGIHNFDVSVINPNRRAQLARIGRRSTAQALVRTTPERRYQVLVRSYLGFDD